MYECWVWDYKGRHFNEAKMIKGITSFYIFDKISMYLVVNNFVFFNWCFLFGSISFLMTFQSIFIFCTQINLLSSFRWWFTYFISMIIIISYLRTLSFLQLSMKFILNLSFQKLTKWSLLLNRVIIIYSLWYTLELSFFLVSMRFLHR